MASFLGKSVDMIVHKMDVDQVVRKIDVDELVRFVWRAYSSEEAQTGILTSIAFVR